MPADIVSCYFLNGNFLYYYHQRSYFRLSLWWSVNYGVFCSILLLFSPSFTCSILLMFPTLLIVPVLLPCYCPWRVLSILFSCINPTFKMITIMTGLISVMQSSRWGLLGEAIVRTLVTLQSRFPPIPMKPPSVIIRQWFHIYQSTPVKLTTLGHLVPQRLSIRGWLQSVATEKSTRYDLFGRLISENIDE